MLRRLGPWGVLVIVSACATRGTRGHHQGPGDSAPLEDVAAPREDDTCAPSKLGLGAAKALPAWQVPSGCQAVSSAGTALLTIRNETEFQQQFTCRSGIGSGVDFAAHDLIVSTRMMSPAGAGTRVVDDGKTTTLIALSRSPCPNSPMPMPMSYTLGFLLPAHASRAFGEKDCTFPPHCD